MYLRQAGLTRNPTFRIFNAFGVGDTARLRKPRSNANTHVASNGAGQRGLRDKEMNLAYPIKHWLTSLVIGPLIMITYDAVTSSKLMVDAIGIFFLFLTFGLLLSLPTFILYILTFTTLIKKEISNLTIKIILNTLAIIGTVLTFLTIKGSMTELLIICYSTSLIVGSLLYRVRPKEINKQII